MSEIVERVAAAIREIRVGDHYCLYPHEAEEIARAAIDAMREPTAEMISAGREEYSEYELDYDATKMWTDMWRAMVDAALKAP
jgi:hypothetical protein